MNRVLLFILSALSILVSANSNPCSNENLIFSRENFEVYRDNISAVNLGLPECSKIPAYLDQIKLTILGTSLSGTINLNVDNNIRFLTIDKRGSQNISINATRELKVERLELRSQANWFILNSNTEFFSKFPMLTHLIAENIILPDLPSFTNHPGLTRIQVMKSSFKESDNINVTRTFVSGLSGLRLLWWKNSRITSLSTDAFTGLDALTELNFENNQLQQIEADQFNINSLLELDLSHNNLTTSGVKNNAFRGLSALTYLALNSNPFFAPSILFHPMYSLEKIYIQNNMYTLLDFKAFEQKANLAEIHLIGDNMFNCTCDTTSWMAIASSNFSIRFFGGVCETPALFLNRPVTEMTLYNNNVSNCTQEFSYACFRDHNCTVEQVCVDTQDSFRCECVNGLEVVERNGIETCVDIDECSRINSCERLCTNTIGSFFCTCENTYTLDPNGMNCTDINECLFAVQPCQQDGEPEDGLCRNIEGGFNCMCNGGYNLVSPTNCEDINECEVLAETDCIQTCNNTDGDYECICFPGFEFNTTATPVLRVGISTTGNKGLPCVDVDECFTGTDTCAQNCNNTFGSFICSCNEGYKLANTTRCVNINECVLNSTLCDANRGMRCNDTEGSFECICLPAHVLTTRENITICVPLASGLSTGAKAGIGITMFVIGAVMIAVVIILIYLIWLRGRRRAKLQKKGSREVVFPSELQFELPEIIIESPGHEDAKHNLANVYEVMGPPDRDSNVYTTLDTLNGEDISQSKTNEESERVRVESERMKVESERVRMKVESERVESERMKVESERVEESERVRVESERVEESERMRVKEIADGSTSVLLENEDMPGAEPPAGEEAPKYRDILV